MTTAELGSLLEQTGAAAWLRGSHHAYPLVNVTHVASIGILLTSVMLLHARFAGLLARLDREAFEVAFRRLAIAAAAAAILTGIALFSVKAGEYLANPAFLFKVAALLAAALNFLVWLAVPAWRGAGSVVSAMLWLSVLVAGRYIAFV